MKIIYLNLIILSILIVCCKAALNEEDVIKTINVKTEKEECYFFIEGNKDTLSFSRNIQILENSLSDTIILGNSILKPNFLGVFEYTKYKDQDIILDLKYKNPQANRLWVYPYKKKISEGELKIRLVKE